MPAMRRAISGTFFASSTTESNSRRRTPMRFRDRIDAGRRLASVVGGQELESPLVLALPRGGVPVAFEVARALDAPLEVFVARKVGAPTHPEFGIGAVAEGGVALMDPRAVRALALSREAVARLVEAERHELDRRVRRYRGDRPFPDVGGRDVI